MANKKLFRDPMNRVIGGVCAGIANYFGIERWIIRALLLAFIFIPYINYFFAFIIPVYIILWVSVPKGMNNENMAFSNEKSASGSLLGFMGGIFDGLWRFILKITGFALFIVLLFSCLIIYIVLSYNGAYINVFLPDGYPVEQLRNVLWILFAFPVLVVFLVVLLLLGRKLVIKSFYLFLAFLAWIFVLIYAIVTNLSLLNQFNVSLQTSYEIPINTTEKIIDVMSTGAEFPKNSFSFGTGTEMILGNLAIIDSGVICSDVKFTIEKFEGNEPKLFYKISAFGTDTAQARKHQKQVSYNFQQVDNDIVLSPYFKLLPKTKWRNQQVEIILYLPEGFQLRINDAAAFNLEIEGLPEEKHATELIGRNLVMTKSGLEVSKF